MTEENSKQETVWGESFKNTVGDLMPRTLGKEPRPWGPELYTPSLFSDASWQFLSGSLPFPSWGLALRILWLQAKKKFSVNMEKGIYWREMGELSGLKENQESSLETIGIAFSGVLGSGNWWVSPYRAIGPNLKHFFSVFVSFYSYV